MQGQFRKSGVKGYIGDKDPWYVRTKCGGSLVVSSPVFDLSAPRSRRQQRSRSSGQRSTISMRLLLGTARCMGRRAPEHRVARCTPSVPAPVLQLWEVLWGELGRAHV